MQLSLAGHQLIRMSRSHRMNAATITPGDGAVRLVLHRPSIAARAREAARRRLPSTLYWSIRARRFGARGVLNLAHSEAEAPQVLARQEAILMPLLAKHLTSDDHVALDFGCGPGRFTPALALRIGHAIGVDPVGAYLDMAPTDTGAVEYRRIEGGRIPVDTASIDVVWVCLVLGSITRPRDFERAIDELRRVLRPGDSCSSSRTRPPGGRTRPIRPIGPKRPTVQLSASQAWRWSVAMRTSVKR